MQIQELIIQLIIQDMKHQQLVEAICKAGFETDRNGLEIYVIVAELMGLDVANIPSRWLEVYWNCLGVVGGLPIAVHGNVYRSLAEVCYMLLANA